MKMPSIVVLAGLALLASATRGGAQRAASGASTTVHSARYAATQFTDSGSRRQDRGSRVTTMRGTLEKVDTTARVIVVKTREGGDATLQFTEATSVHGLGPLRSAAMLGGEEGMEVVVRYTDDKVAQSIVLTGGVSVDLAIGTVVAFDRAAKTLQVNTADGTGQLFQLGEYCTINTARGVEEAVTAQGHVLKKGGLVVLYFTQEGGQRVVRAIDEISHNA